MDSCTSLGLVNDYMAVLDLACLTIYQYDRYDFTRISLRNHIPKMLCIFLTGGVAYAPYATCMARPTPLPKYVHITPCFPVVIVSL